ncbi:uncharacterized protein DS421_12g363250 [Arachis hypogaea]|nr:uncharacterized protein DS421_12g363250 [Arachis hypogaea]
MLTCDHPVPSDRYDDRVEEHLLERWHPDTHTFHIPIGECDVTLEDVAMILGFLTDGLPVTGMTISSVEALEAECLHQFGAAPRRSKCRGSGIKLTWLRDLKERLQLTDEENKQRYVKCHIMLLLNTILLGDKSGSSVHWKFLPLLRDFGSIAQFIWGSACLTHLYRALCRASRFDCKKIDSSLTLLLIWAWIRLPFLAPVPREPCSFPLANRWRNWERGDRRFRYMKLAHFRKAFDDLQEGQFVWVAYSVDRVDPDIIPADIYMHSVVWSATVPLVSFEWIEWHATDRCRRQFGFVQGVPHQERNLDKAHEEVLTGPKNLNWATATSHSFWVMQWTNRYNHVLNENDEGDQGMDDVDQENEEAEKQEPNSSPPPPPPPPPQEQPQWFMAADADQSQYGQQPNIMATDAGQSHYGHQADFMSGRYSLDASIGYHTSSCASGGLVSGDSSRSDGGRGVLNSQNPNRVSMTLIEENTNTLEKETDEYLVDEPDDEDDDDEEDEEMDEDLESRNDSPDDGDDAGEGRTPDDTRKGYNLRVDPSRHSANRFTPSVFKKAAKKCKSFVKDVKWAMRK